MIRDAPSAQGTIPYIQLLDAAGRTTAPLPGFASDPVQLLAMYRVMTLARVFDTKAVNLQRTGRLGTYPSCLGHEATHVGAAAALRADDTVFPVYREIGAKFWRGIAPRDVLLYWGGDERGSDFATSRHDFPFCVPIASQLPHAAGAALAFQLRGEARCALAFIGDGGTSQGAFYEALNFAGARSLPLVTVIVNNGWAISVPVSAQTRAETLAHKAFAAGMPGVQVDGNDVLAVRHVVAGALTRARAGAGPTLIEALTYRLSDHTTADDAGRYRQATEVEAARAKEPMIRTRRYLESLGVWDEAREQALRADCAAQVETAVAEYMATPRQGTDAMFDYLYAELPRGLERQREEARRYPGKH
jgi:pyruvate dehydrogenase E1 component alpha subunit